MAADEQEDDFFDHFRDLNVYSIDGKAHNVGEWYKDNRIVLRVFRRLGDHTLLGESVLLSR